MWPELKSTPRRPLYGAEATRRRRGGSGAPGVDFGGHKALIRRDGAKSTQVRALSPFYPSLPFTIHCCSSSIVSGGAIGSKQQESAAAVREVLAAPPARHRKDTAARAQAQKLGMATAAHGRKAATVAATAAQQRLGGRLAAPPNLWQPQPDNVGHGPA